MKHSFFQRALEGNNKWWTFLVGLLVVSAGFTVGQLPITILLLVKMTQIIQDDPSLINEVNEKMLAYDFEYFGLSSNLSFFLILLSFVGGIYAVYLVVKYIHKRDFLSIITPFKNINWAKVTFGFSVWFGMTLIIEFIGYFIDPGNYVWTFEWQSFLPLLLMCIFLLPLQTSFEEVFMRGYLMQGIPLQPSWIFLSFIIVVAPFHILMKFQEGIIPLLSTTGIYLAISAVIVLLFHFKKFENLTKILYNIIRKPITPLIITSLIFGLMHGMNPEVAKFGLGKMMVFYIGMGFFLGLITLLDETLELALGVHFGNNLFGALFVSFDGSALQTPTLFRALEMNTDYMLIGWFGMVSVFMAIAYMKYRWKNWGKLFQNIEYDTINIDIEHIPYFSKNEDLNVLDDIDFNNESNI